MFNEIFHHFKNPGLANLQIDWGRALFRDAGVYPHDSCLVFTTRKDGLRPISYNLWWVFQPYPDESLGFLIDRDTAEKYVGTHWNAQIGRDFSLDVGVLIVVRNCDPHQLPAYVRAGAVNTLAQLVGRGYNGAPHTRYDNLAYRSLFFQEAHAFPALLLSWNPDEWTWDDLDRDYECTWEGGSVAKLWRTANRKDVFVGMRFYLLKQGHEPRGIMASGTVAEVPKTYGTVKADGSDQYAVRVTFDTILHPDDDDLLPRETLIGHPVLSTVHWDTAGSGIKIAPESAIELDALWRAHLVMGGGFPGPAGSPTSVLPNDERHYYEGAKRQMSVDRYERSGLARKAAITHHGLTCRCCGMNFEEMYGDIGEGFIHIHHLTPMSTDEDRKVDPKTDLVPVCPNCHAMLHRREREPRLVNELRKIIEDRRNQSLTNK